MLHKPSKTCPCKALLLIFLPMYRARIGQQCHADCTPTPLTLMIDYLPMGIYFVFGEREGEQAISHG
jgi:hypothetical protein